MGCARRRAWVAPNPRRYGGPNPEGSAAEETEDRKHPAVAVSTRGEVELVEDVRHVLLDRSHAHLEPFRKVVPCPGGLMTSNRPSRAASRSQSPCNPEPRLWSAPPEPSSPTSTRRTVTSAAPASCARMVTRPAPACLT